mmetsp:Transcript_5236/g.21583  ORF Transcript_5236/g.21583 Transcript_5236/m.21583 type:complete len:269 (-) Transcript_5236:290-1096(-)
MKVASAATERPTTKSKAFGGTSSGTRPHTASAFDAPAAVAQCATTVIFLPRPSARQKSASGHAIANGNPGNPPPVPASRMRARRPGPPTRHRSRSASTLRCGARHCRDGLNMAGYLVLSASAAASMAARSDVVAPPSTASAGMSTSATGSARLISAKRSNMCAELMGGYTSTRTLASDSDGCAEDDARSSFCCLSSHAAPRRCWPSTTTPDDAPSSPAADSTTLMAPGQPRTDDARFASAIVVARSSRNARCFSQSSVPAQSVEGSAT